MPDKSQKPQVEQHQDSGAFKVTLPDSPKGGESRVDVNPGSHLHPVLADTTHEPDPVIEERRRHPAPVQVSVQQPQAGGLRGWPATIANMSAVGFVLLLSFIMYRDFVATVKDRDALIREEAKLARESADRNNQAIVTALAGLQTKTDALAVSNTALAAEFRASRIAMEALATKLLKQPDP